MVTMDMVIVAGHLIVDPDDREAYLEGCRRGVEQAAAIRAASVAEYGAVEERVLS
jgi:hypothetical protein